MPAPGDQHKNAGAVTANPYEEDRPHISEYTAREIATLQSRLNKRLGPEYISTRPGPGNQKVAYLSAEKAINLANEVFGFNGWSSSIQQIQVDYVDEDPQTKKVSLGLSVVVRVTLRDGTYHEDIGYGGIDNCSGKAMAFEKSKKEATTDALKRTLRNFGNVLGNCIYDKEFVNKVSKIKPGPAHKFDVNDLHRHADYIVKQEKEDDNAQLAIESQAQAPIQNTAPVPHGIEFEDSFDMGEFDDADFEENGSGRPDEVLIAGNGANSAAQRQSYGRAAAKTPSKPPQIRPPINHTAITGQMQTSNPGGANRRITSNQPLQPQQNPQSSAEGQQSSPSNPKLHGVPLPGQPVGQAPTAGFYSARAAQNIDPNALATLPPTTAKFNPHAESPSIRKTAGIDHHRSVPVKRDLLLANNMTNATIVTTNPPEIADPRIDANRRGGPPIQAVPTPPRVGMSTSAYRPPTRHTHSSTAITNGTSPVTLNNTSFNSAKRPPLGDVSNMQQHTTTAVTSDGLDAKRQKLGSGPPGPGPPQHFTAGPEAPSI